MSKIKDQEDSFNFNLQDGLDVDEYDDELNDETFGDPIQDDWEAEQDIYNEKLEKCIEQMQKIVGDKIPVIDLKMVATKYDFDYELALNSLLEDDQFRNRILARDNAVPKPIESNGNAKQHDLTDDDLIKNTLDRVANQQFNNQLQYQQMMQQLQMQHQQSLRNQQQLPSLFLNQHLNQQLNQQQYPQTDLQSPHFLPIPPTQLIPPHLQPQLINQLIQQQQQQRQQQTNNLDSLANNSLTNATLNDSFASMNLNSNFQNRLNLSNMQQQNMNSTFQVNKFNNLQKNDLSQYFNQGLMNGNNQQQEDQSTPAKPRALTLEEIEQGLLDENKKADNQQNDTPIKRMTLEDIESALYSNSTLNQSSSNVTSQMNNQFNNNQFNSNQFNSNQFNSNQFNRMQPRDDSTLDSLNLNNLSEFPKLGEFVKQPEKTHASTTSSTTTGDLNQQSNNNHNDRRFQQNQFNMKQNFRNQNYQNNHHNQNRNNANNLNFRNYHPSLIPNPLNPAELIRNDNLVKNGFNQNKYQNKHSNQHQRNFNMNQYVNRSSDEYAGLMTPKDINWLRRIQQMQLEFDDPYVQDYYFVNYQTRKIAAELKKRDKLNGETHSAPQLVIPERSNKLLSNTTNNSSDTNSTDTQSRYVPPDFSGSLGKIRVANVNYPRKLLDFENKLDKLTKNNENVEPTGRKELNKFRRLLLDIERNLTMVLKIDHEDKKIAALPPEAQIPHLEERKRLCDELFTGILTTDDNLNVNFEIAKIRKGCMLIFKALQVLEEPGQKTVIISDLLKVDNFHHVVMQKDKTIYCLDYGQVLIDAIKTIKNCDFDYLLSIANGLDDASTIAKFQCGQEIIEVLLNQYRCFNVVDEREKNEWRSFLERIKEDIEDITHMKQLCDEHLSSI